MSENDERSRSINADVDKFLTFGEMAFEQGWYDKAREYYDRVLAIDPSNEKAQRAVVQIGEMLARRKSTVPIDEETYLAELKVERAKEIAEAKARWVERRAKLGDVPLQKGQCPECGSLDAQCRKESSPIVQFAQIMIWPVGYLIDPFLPEVCHCNFCGAEWRVRKL